MKRIEPSIGLTSFNCPHCNALAQQFWGRAVLENLDDNELPSLIATHDLDRINANISDNKDLNPERKEHFRRHFRQLAIGLPFIFELDDGIYSHHQISNVWVSRCYNCQSVAFWIYDRLIWPDTVPSQDANADLPEEIRLDFNEAGFSFSARRRSAPAPLHSKTSCSPRITGQESQRRYRNARKTGSRHSNSARSRHRSRHWQWRRSSGADRSSGRSCNCR